MLKKYYYLIAVPLVCLLFSHTALAATTVFSSSITDADGNTKTFKGVSYTQIPYDEMEDYENSQGGHNPVYKWHVNQNYRVEGFTTQKYYTGLMTWTIKVTPSIAMDRNSPLIESTNAGDGLYVFIRYAENDIYQIVMVFDNFFTRATWVGFPTITQEFWISMSSQQPSLASFTYSVIDKYTNIRGTDTPLDSGLAGLIADSIDNSTALAVIAGYLYDISQNDYTYYTGLVSQIASVLSAQNITNARLQSILNEIDLDFQQVQTVLDLFPSYRSQVLQYWQDLLAMNAAQSSEAAEVESEYADKEAQSATLAAGLGQLVLPSVSSNDFNVLNQVDGTQKANFFGLLSIITNNGFITTLLIIVVTGAIVGYILYGKK